MLQLCDLGKLFLQSLSFPTFMESLLAQEERDQFRMPACAAGTVKHQGHLVRDDQTPPICLPDSNGPRTRARRCYVLVRLGCPIVTECDLSRGAVSTNLLIPDRTSVTGQ